MHAQRRIFTVALSLIALQLGFALSAQAAATRRAPAHAVPAAAPATTPVHASAAQVARLLFVAGDVGRLSQIPSGVESVVLEKVLQTLYIENPTLAPATAVSDIQALQAALGSGGQALSVSTLTVMAGNQRVLAIIHALLNSAPPTAVAHALAQISDQALTEASQSTLMLGQPFDASSDSLNTLSYGGFSPARTLNGTATQAASNTLFGQARDTLWKSASHESVFDSTQTLLGENPALQNNAVNAFVAGLGSDGSLTTNVGNLENTINANLSQVDNQNCTLASGSSGGHASDCVSGVLYDAQHVAAVCPGGASDTSPGCMTARSQALTDGNNEAQFVAAAQAATAAEADALGLADQNLQQAEVAATQANAEIANEENQYLTYQSTQQYVKAGFDAVSLVATLSVSEIDPVAALTGLFNVVGDAVGLGFNGPDPNTIILSGLQNVSQQISDFENYTQSAFHVLDAQLSNLTTQIAQDAYQLSAQLTQAQQQITQLATQLGTLQSSVDHLQSEVQSLFAQGARNDLSTLINQYIGYQQLNGVPLPQTQFAQAAGALYQDATGTALTSTVLNPPTGFSAAGAASLVTGSDPLSLDANINFFNYFPTQVTDSAVSWPGNLSNNCALNSTPSQLLCLPDPDFWSTSSRAFAQLLSENPAYVTPLRVTQLQSMIQEGQLIANALGQLSVNDAGTDSSGTGNQTLDAAINYYSDWGKGNHAAGTLPSLGQAIRNEESRYLGSMYVPGQQVTYNGVSPWGTLNQYPDYATLQTQSSFTHVQPCGYFAGLAGISASDPHYALPRVPSSLFSFLPTPVLNAVRLGIGHIYACWGANFYGAQPGGTGPDGLQGNLVMSITYNYVSNNGAVNEQVGEVVGTAYGVSDCTNDGNGPNYLEAADNVVGNWPGDTSPNSSCPYMAATLASSSNQTMSYPADVQSTIEPAITAELNNLVQGVYNDLVPTGSALTTGKDDATNVAAAAERLQGANALVDGYITLGFPQALASDDNLRSLVSGVNNDAFASTNPNYNFWNVQPAADVPTQLVNFYKAAQAANPGFDPAGFVDDLVYIRSYELQSALNPYIVPASGTMAAARLGTDAQRASRLIARTKRTTKGLAFRHATSLATAIGSSAAPAAAAAAASATVLDETDRIIGPTLDRLAETATGLQDIMTNGTKLFVQPTGTGTGTVTAGTTINCPATCAHKYTAGTSVALTATPTNGSTFAGWTGACSGTAACTVILTHDQTVGAMFVAATMMAKPTVSKLSPTAGPLAGKTKVTITGTNFVSGASVRFGSVAASTVTFVSATKLTAVAPAQAAGTVDVTVTTAGGTSATVTTDRYTYDPAPAVTALSPATGPTTGGTQVTITGTNFLAGAKVKFGTIAATSVTVVSPTQITAVSPAEAAASVPVRVVTAGGTSALSAADVFTY